MGTLVVGYTNRPEGRAALCRAFEEASLRLLDVVVVVSQPASWAQDNGPQHPPENQVIAAVVEEIATHGVQWRLHYARQSIDPAEDLLATVSETTAELIVIGLRKRTAVGKLLLGSTAQRILLEAPCAVLGIKSIDDRP